MKKILLAFFICAASLKTLIAQNQVANLEKYWNYRERLRQRFIVINENVEQFGVNIPASGINLDAGIVGWED